MYLRLDSKAAEAVRQVIGAKIVPHCYRWYTMSRRHMHGYRVLCYIFPAGPLYCIPALGLAGAHEWRKGAQLC